MAHRGEGLRPGGILAGAARAGRRNWWQILAVAIPVTVVGAGVEIVIDHYVDPTDAALTTSTELAAAGVSLLGTVLLAGIICRLVGATEHGMQRPNLLAVARSMPWRRLITADLLVAAIVVIGLGLLILPGLVAVTLLAVVGPIIEIEHQRVFDSFRRSAHLVRRRIWLVILLATVPLALVSEVESVAPDPHRTDQIAAFLLIRGIAEGIAEACVALVLVELCFQLIDADRAARKKPPGQSLSGGQPGGAPTASRPAAPPTP